jgi:hypothetical protein
MLGHESTFGKFLDNTSLLDRLNEGIPIEAKILTHAWVVDDSKIIRNKKLVDWTQGKGLFMGGTHGNSGAMQRHIKMAQGKEAAKAFRPMTWKPAGGQPPS